MEQLSRNENRQNIYLVYSFFFYGILQGVSLIEAGETAKSLGSIIMPFLKTVMETIGLYDLTVGPYCETSTSQLSFPPVSEEHVPLFQPTDNPYPWALQLMNSVYSGTLLYLFSVSHLNLTRTFYRGKLTSLLL